MKPLASLIFSVLLLALGSTGAFAASASERAIIGFSKDGRYFAFEEFGTSDGTGSPYVSIYILDLEKDAWVKGSPIREGKGEGDERTVYEARRQALTKAAPLIEKYGTIHHGRTVASNAVGEDAANPKAFSFKLYHNISKRWHVKLGTHKLDAPHCTHMKDVNGDPVLGFSLTVAKGDEEPNEIYRDKKIPKSRGCPVEYRLADVIAPPEGTNGRSVILIHKLTFGFEGRDASFIAVPADMPSWR